MELVGQRIIASMPSLLLAVDAELKVILGNRRVFDPFYSTQEVGQGVGLGLSIAYHMITQNHRGFMSVSSAAGAGSSFAVYLPTLKNG